MEHTHEDNKSYIPGTSHYCLCLSGPEHTYHLSKLHEIPIMATGVSENHT